MKRLIFLVLTIAVLISLSACSHDVPGSPEIEGGIDTTASTDNFADLGNKIWIDENKDGIKQRPESGFAGITVNLYKDANADGVADGGVFKTQVTNSKGYYRFNAIDPGINYLLEVVVPSGYKLSQKHNSQAKTKDYDSDINPDTGFSDSISLAKGRYYYWFDAALQPLAATPKQVASVGDKIWLDSNNDGIKQRPEAGLANIKLNLWLDKDNDATPDEIVASTTTNSEGNYRFRNLDISLNYYLQIELGDYGVSAKHNPAAEGKDWDNDFNKDGFSDRLELTAGKFNYWLADGALHEKAAGASELWHQWLGSSNVTYATAVATDSQDNVYLAGRSSGELFGHSSLGRGDAFVVKYDKDGNKIWDRWLASSANDFVLEIAIDKNDNFYLSGYTGGSILGHSNVGKNDGFIVKYDSAGNKLWDKWFASVQDDSARGLAIDSANNVYLTVNTTGGLFNQKNKGGQDSFIVKYDQYGHETWYKHIASNGWDDAMKLAIDKNDKVYLVGYTAGSLFGNTNQGGSDIFVLILDTYANEINNIWLATNKADKALDLAVDNSGGIYVAGTSMASLFNESHLGNLDAFVVKYSQNGTQQWHKWYATAGSESIKALVTDSENNVYVAGTTELSLFGETNKGRSDIFVLKYSSTGQEAWHKWLASQYGDYATDLAMDTDNALYLSGASFGSLFNEAKQFGATDSFIVKYK